MNTISSRSVEQTSWATIVMFVLGFWLSSSLVLDALIVPGLSSAGMMSQPGFASAGYTIFGIFNHLELLGAAVVLTGCLALRQQHYFSNRSKTTIIFAGILLAIAIIYTYILTPQLSGWGLYMNSFESVSSMPQTMVVMQGIYWALEAVKFLLAATLLRWCYRHSCIIQN